MSTMTWGEKMREHQRRWHPQYPRTLVVGQVVQYGQRRGVVVETEGAFQPAGGESDWLVTVRFDYGARSVLAERDLDAVRVVSP